MNKNKLLLITSSVIIVGIVLHALQQHGQVVSLSQAAVAACEKDMQALKSVQGQIDQVQPENDRLRQMPRYYFDQAVDAQLAAERSDSNDADAAAVAKFEDVLTRFPNDPLAKAARERTKALEARISARNLAIKRKQEEVVKLIQECKSSAASLWRISGNSNDLLMNGYNGPTINVDLMVRRADQARPYTQTIEKAKSRAKGLLRDLPDPDYSLSRQVENCDSKNQE